MQYVPHDYQTVATDFIVSHPVAAVFLQMGLGKSVITLTAIQRLLEKGAVHRVLVIAPLRVARDTWPEELCKWDHLSSLTWAVAVGSEKERCRALSREVQIHIINRENVPWLVEHCDFPYDMLVIDELSSFKSHLAKRFEALLRVRPRLSRVVGLTGTPAPNGLMDLFAEFRVLDMGKRLGRFITQYRLNYFVPDKCNGQRVYSWKLRRGAEEEIYRRIDDITLSMRSLDYIRMPELVNTRVPVYLSQTEQDQYDTLKQELVLQLPGGVVDAKNAAVLCGKLLQMANGAVYMESGFLELIHSRKLEALQDLVEAANGRPLLVAYWYQHDLARIRAWFPEARHLVSSRDMADWNAGKIPLALIHPASAGHGLNLQAGGAALVWFGLTWSLELYQQTNARLWRQGQKSDTVVIHHIVAAGTIDEQILTALLRKELNQEALMYAVRAELKKGVAA